MLATPLVTAPFVDGLAQPPDCNSPAAASNPQDLPFLGPLCNSLPQHDGSALGLVRAAGPAQLGD